MQSGIAAFDPPRKMEVGLSYPVKLVVGTLGAESQIVDSATDEGQVKTVDVQLGAWVCAELLAPQFKVGSPARQCRERGTMRMLAWNWTVEPRRDGQLKLGVKVESFASKGGAPIDAIDSRMIAVDVTADGISAFNLTVQRLTESIGGFRNLLLALARALGVLSVIVWRIRTLGQRPDKDALKDLTAS